MRYSKVQSDEPFLFEVLQGSTSNTWSFDVAFLAFWGTWPRLVIIFIISCSMSVGYPALLCGGLDFGTFPTIQYLGGSTYYDVGVPPVVWIPRTSNRKDASDRVSIFS